MTQNVLVLCTGNSCRSIMAEALINARRGSRYRAFSAGSHPTGRVHPLALTTLRHHGIDPGNPKSQSWDEYAKMPFEYVITVCDDAAKAPCPVFAGEAKRLHWSTPDPAAVEGSAEEIEHAFETAFLQLSHRVAEALP